MSNSVKTDTLPGFSSRITHDGAVGFVQLEASRSARVYSKGREILTYINIGKSPRRFNHTPGTGMARKELLKCNRKYNIFSLLR